jgi:hypothetical protein
MACSETLPVMMRPMIRSVKIDVSQVLLAA